jgi:UDP-2,3-diacylglucosamine hydrolase
VSPVAGQPVAIMAGAGALPPLVAAAAAEQGRSPIVFAIAGEAEPAAFGAFRQHVVRWGEIGRMLRLMKEAACSEAVLVGTITRRPDFQAMRPDIATLKLLPRILQLLRNGDEGLLRGVAMLFNEQGIELLSPLAVAPSLALPDGLVAGQADDQAMDDAAKAAEAARLIGRLDIGQGAVAVHGRVVAAEDAGGTRELLKRVAALRAEGRIRKTGGVLVKCAKPQQDLRLDLPTIGPATAEEAKMAGLSGVAGEAGRALLAGRDETIAAFRQAGLFLLGLPPPARGTGHGE